MENGARYVVTTKWGSFSLDEASYQSYLAGKLWISWGAGKKEEAKPAASVRIPPNVTPRAIALRDKADREGVLAALAGLNLPRVIVPYSSRLCDLSIDELNLSVRAHNGLRRSGTDTFGKLRDLLATERGVLSIRNLGQISAKEINRAFVEECYTRLLPHEKALYWQKMLDR